MVGFIVGFFSASAMSAQSARRSDTAGNPSGSNGDSYPSDEESTESYTINFSIRVRSLKKIIRQEIGRSREEKKSRRKAKKVKKSKKKKDKTRSKSSRDKKSSCTRRGKSTRTRSEQTRSASKTRSPTRLDCLLYLKLQFPISRLNCFCCRPMERSGKDFFHCRCPTVVRDGSGLGPETSSQLQRQNAKSFLV